MTNRSESEKLLHERDAARLLGISAAWLQKQRWRGTGPAFIRVSGTKGGAVRYALADIESWIERNRIASLDQVEG